MVATARAMALVCLIRFALKAPLPGLGDTDGKLTITLTEAVPGLANQR